MLKSIFVYRPYEVVHPLGVQLRMAGNLSYTDLSRSRFPAGQNMKTYKKSTNGFELYRK